MEQSTLLVLSPAEIPQFGKAMYDGTTPIEETKPLDWKFNKNDLMEVAKTLTEKPVKLNRELEFLEISALNLKQSLWPESSFSLVNVDIGDRIKNSHEVKHSINEIVADGYQDPKTSSLQFQTRQMDVDNIPNKSLLDLIYIDNDLSMASAKTSKPLACFMNITEEDNNLNNKESKLLLGPDLSEFLKPYHDNSHEVKLSNKEILADENRDLNNFQFQACQFSFRQSVLDLNYVENDLSMATPGTRKHLPEYLKPNCRQCTQSA